MLRGIKKPIFIFFLAIVCLLLFSNLWTAKKLQREHEMRVEAIANVENSLLRCQPAIYLPNSMNPVDAIPQTEYRNNQTGHACVFFKDGRYGHLWWSIVKESPMKAHIEYNFSELGKYKW